MSTLRATAYHEAGHAVVAIFLDVGFEKVTINGDERAAGRIIYVDPEPGIQEAGGSGDRDDPRVKQSAENSLIVTLAGAIAQRRFSPRSDWRFGSTGDEKNVTNRIADLGYLGEDAETFQKDLEERAEALVKEYWPEIKKVADALLENKILFVDDVQRLVFGSFDDDLND